VQPLKIFSLSSLQKAQVLTGRLTWYFEASLQRGQRDHKIYVGHCLCGAKETVHDDEGLCVGKPLHPLRMAE
jgi:hypothetical protein